MTCHVMYAEYARTAEKVIANPKTRPIVGERSDGDGRDTPRAYNAGTARVTGCWRPAGRDV